MEAEEQLDLHTLIFHIFFSMALQNRFHSFLGHQDFVAVWVDQVEWSALWLCRALGRSPETCIWQRVTCALWASCIGSWTQTIPFSDSSYGCKQTCDFNIPGRAHKVFNRESGSPVEKKDRLLSNILFHFVLDSRRNILPWQICICHHALKCSYPSVNAVVGTIRDNSGAVVPMTVAYWEVSVLHNRTNDI